ncbi:MAG: replicative DNA helicase [Chloroflexi bacterium]|jgi:replicative DNA helicase|nr:MAG: replicative DNA helicase [Chloroflexota bacterium]
MYSDRVPPHDDSAEEAVLGSILVDGSSFVHVAPVLKPEDFYRERNRWSYEACLAIFQRGEPITQISVSHELETLGQLEGSGGAAFLSHLVASVPTSVYIEHYALIVSRSATMRNLISAATEIAALGYQQDADLESSLGQAEELLFKIRSRRENRDFVPLRSILDKYLEDSSSLEQDLDQNSGPISTGFKDLDTVLGGLQRSDLVIIAARPSMGKSTLALNISQHAASNGFNVGIFSLEMSAEQMVMRLLSSEAQVDSHSIRINLMSELEQQRVINAVGALSDLPIYVDDTPIQSIIEVRSKARRFHLQRRVDLIVVDYLQLMQGGSRSDNRVQEMSDISRALKGLARDLNVPLIALSQLSRAVEQRPGHRPQLSDLRDSGSIEQDADVVAFIYRDDMYYTEEDWERANPMDPYPKNIADLIIAKHRNGPLKTMNLYFRDQFSRFENLAAHRAI